MKKFKADMLIFDMDGTLVDSRQDIVNCANYTLRKLGLDEKPYDEVVGCVGHGVKNLVSQVVGPKNLHLHKEAVDIFRSYMGIKDDFRSVLYDGVFEVLHHFAAKKKIIATNRPYESAIFTLKKLGIYEYFDMVYGGEEEESKLKPSPYMINSASDKFGIPKNKIVMIGDMDVDVESAKNANVYSVAAAYGFINCNHIYAPEPDCKIFTINELKNVVE